MGGRGASIGEYFCVERSMFMVTSIISYLHLEILNSLL